MDTIVGKFKQKMLDKSDEIDETCMHRQTIKSFEKLKNDHFDQVY